MNLNVAVVFSCSCRSIFHAVLKSRTRENMPKNVSTFKAAWQDQHDWLIPVQGQPTKAKCKLCGKEFSVANSGLGQVKQHAETEKHKQVSNTRSGTSSQRLLLPRSSDDGAISLSATPSVSFSTEEQTLRAEILWAMKCAQSNFSFSSNTNLASVFRAMFPDSEIARNYGMSESKIKYVLAFGVAPYVRERLIDDLQSCPFTFLFDETTTSQVKKQYDGYVQYESRQYKKIITHYAGSLFLGHCTAEQLKSHFFEFGESLKWDLKYLLHIGMDGPNVNKSFHKTLENELLTVHGKKILNIGTCNLHPVHTAFSKGLAKLNFDLDKLPHNLHFFFKFSAARRQDFALSELETELEAQQMLRHVSSRWLSLKKVLARILQQFVNLQQYFLQFLPKEKNFDREIKNTERYIAIAKALKAGDETKLYMAFATYLAGILEEFLLRFQSSEPMIHLLYDGFGQTMFDLMSNFVPRDALHDGNRRLEAKDLGLLDVKSLRMSVHDVNPGTEARHLIAKLEANNKNIDLVKHEIRSCYEEMVIYLQKHFPHGSTFLRDARALHPDSKRKCNSQAAFGRLAYMMSSVLNNTGIYVKPAAQFSDDIRRQHSQYETVDFAYTPSQSIDNYWTTVGEYVGADGKPRFAELATLAKNCLCVSHGNAEAERGFSVNKRLLQDRTQLNEKTIVAMRIIKETLVQHGGDVSIIS